MTYDNANFSIYVVPVVFAITIADSIMAFGISAMAHVLLAAVVITVGTSQKLQNTNQHVPMA